MIQIKPYSHDSTLSMYREMIDYYLDNIGNQSKYSPTGKIITPKLIKMVVKRYNQLVPDSSIIILNGELSDERDK